MSATETFQIPAAVAETYESKFVPALFAEWAPHLVNAAGVASGHRVLDVACGTGIVARAARDVVGPRGRVVGVDVNDAMLVVARRVRPDLEWRRGDAGDLPFPDGAFDLALCQMALMFLPDRARALREMRRVVTAGGTVAVLVPDALRAQPAYAPFVAMVARHAGPDTMSLLGTYFACGDLAELVALVESAGLRVVETRTRLGHARFDSVDEFVAAEVKSTPLMERVSDGMYERIREEARDVLRPFTSPAGAVAVPLACHLVVGRGAAMA
jgi:ubiquinone/menaquinone biosynthesis C-methylase UbiE